jgi:protein dithiol oxidoreductase (disulfide-forming)
MRSLRLAVIVAALAASVAASAAFASPTDPKQGVEYTVLAQPQPSQSVGKKIEVIEFFMYHCPHCRALEPVLEQWVAKQGDSIVFRRIHMPYQGAGDPEAHLFLTLQALGKNDELQRPAFEGMRQILMRDRRITEPAVYAWAVSQPGIDKAAFASAWRSFGVSNKMIRLPAVVESDYGVNGVPTLIVDGKYVTSPAQVAATMPDAPDPQLFDATFKVVEALIAKAQQGK